MKTADGPTGLRLRADKAGDVPTGTLAQMTRFLIRMAVKTVPNDLSVFRGTAGQQRPRVHQRPLEEAHDQGSQPLTALATRIFHCSSHLSPMHHRWRLQRFGGGEERRREGGKESGGRTHVRTTHHTSDRLDRRTHRPTDRDRNRQRQTKTERLTDSQTGRRTDRPTDRLTDLTDVLPILSTVELPLNKMSRGALRGCSDEVPLSTDHVPTSVSNLRHAFSTIGVFVALATSVTLKPSMSWALSHAEVSCPEADNDEDTGRQDAGILPGGRVPRNFGWCQPRAS